MTVLQDYKQFAGLHWETGTVRNFLDYSGVSAPHTGEPYTEALLMGVSGGAVALREQLAEQLLGICAIEGQAANTLRETMA